MIAVGPLRTHYVRVGPLTFQIRSNQESERFGVYFSDAQYAASAEHVDHRITAVTGMVRPADASRVPAQVQGYREQLFRGGYYTSRYFGPPVLAVSRGNDVVLVGDNLDLLVYRHYLKLYLTLDAERLGSLHLKAACVCCAGRAYLLVTGGGGGKTTFLHAMMEEGAEFVSNTHVLVDEELVAHGVHTNMMFRTFPCDSGFDVASATVDVQESGEALVDPGRLYGAARVVERSGLHGVLLLAKRKDGGLSLEPVSADTADVAMRHFAEGLAYYELKEDLLDWFGGDQRAFVHFAASVESRVAALCRTLPAVLVRADVLNGAVRRELYARLATGRLTP